MSDPSHLMLALPGVVLRSVEARCLEWNSALIKGR
jgi:hypothetical protein